jgi:hypothetical protein
MPELMVDRLRLNLEGLSKADAERLATLVAQGLAGADITGEGDVQSLQITLAPLPGSTMQSLSEQIVAELVGQISRTI